MREERVATDDGSLLKNVAETTIRDYLASSIPSADVKAALTKTLALQWQMQATQRQIADIEKQLAVVTGDHSRVRENLKIVPQDSAHYKTFLEKFVAQDKQIETFLVSLRQLNTTLQSQTNDYVQFLAKLDAE